MQYFKDLLLRILRFLPDKPYLYIFFYLAKREPLHLNKPLKFTEKIQWLKLNGNLERFTLFADKFTVRSYITDKIGSEYLIKLLGVWDRFDDIPFDELPDKFVLKATHGCGYNYICKDKSKIDRQALKAMVDRWLRENFYILEREPQYRFCTPRIVCEEYLEDETGSLRDYKFFCTNGEPQIIQVDTDRFVDHKSDLLDITWNKLSYASVATFGGVETTIQKPKNLQHMLAIARILSQDFPFVRVDLYSVGDKVYFGELTFTPGSGIINFDPADADVELGKLIDVYAYNKA